VQRSLLRHELPPLTGKPWTRRKYQQDAAIAVFDRFEKHDSTIVVLPTGTGKTFLAGKGVIERWLRENRGDVLWITHLDTLVTQAIADLQEMIGIRVGREQAEARWQEDERVCVASVASLYQEGRIKEAVKRGPTLVVYDEGHHASSKGNRRVCESFKGTAKTLFLTATPNRSDGVGLHNVCESVAYEYTMQEAISDGYLVPVEIATARIAGMDFDGLKRKDFNESNIAAVVSSDNVLRGIMRETFAIAGQRQTVMFWTNVNVAHLAADLFNHPELGRPGSSIAVDGTKMDKEVKQERLSDYGAARYQYLHNVGVVVEGYNNKSISAVGMGAPDESFSRYMQKLGRATRPLANVDAYDTAEERRQAIATSAKPNMLVIDFVGNAGRHAERLVTAMDVLAGKGVDEETKRRAKKITESRPVSSEDAIKQARAEIEQEKRAELDRVAAAKAAQFEWQRLNPFDDFPRNDNGIEITSVVPLDAEQVRFLKKVGYTEKDLGKLRDGRHAARQITRLKERHRIGLASFKMVRALKRVGIDARQFSQETAKRLMVHMIKVRTETGRDYLVKPSMDVINAAMRPNPGEDWGE
jgi:superfamily II DNA or RNA helicase